MGRRTSWLGLSLPTLETSAGEPVFARYDVGAPFACFADLAAHLRGRTPGTEGTAGATRAFPRVIILSGRKRKKTARRKRCIE